MSTPLQPSQPAQQPQPQATDECKSASTNTTHADPLDIHANTSSEICLFDLETTFPAKDRPAEIVEFGCINICRIGLYERSSYSTLIKPDRSKVSKRSQECNGITVEMLESAPRFADVAQQIFDNLNNKIWCGHNLIAFDIPQLIRAFREHNLEPPVAAGVIDSLPLVRRLFNQRANGTNKMADLCNHFGLGEEKHRALSDCRHTLEAMKSVALSLLLEREFAPLFPVPVPSTPVKVQRRTSSMGSSAIRSARVSMSSPSTSAAVDNGQSSGQQTPTSTITSTSIVTESTQIQSSSTTNLTAEDLSSRLAAVMLNDANDSSAAAASAAEAEQSQLMTTVIGLIDTYCNDENHPPVSMKYISASDLSSNPETPGKVRAFRSLQWVDRPRKYSAILESTTTTASTSTPISSSQSNREPMRLNFLVERVVSLETSG